jgi:ABC-type ATPase involved in cell division/ABC-type spermidine/putrescine transport system permease subunit II
LEQAGLLMSRWPGVLWRITLPLIAPAILFAAVLVFLLTLGEVGVPTFLRYPVYPVEILTQFAAFYDFSAATAAAIPMLIVTVVILVLEIHLLHTSVLELSAATIGGRNAPIELGRWRVPLFGLALVWTLVTVALPIAVLVVQSASLNVFADAFSRASDSILRSVVFAAIGATLLTLLGFFCGYLVHSRALPLWRSVDALALFLFTLPGTVIGIGLISLWNRPITNAIYATPAIIILGYLAQYAILPTRMTAAILQRIPPSLEQAAQLCGASWFMTLRHVVAPLAKRGLIGAWIIAYIFCLRDLGITLVVYPPGFDTLPVRVLTLMANGAPSLIATMSMIEFRSVCKEYHGRRVIDMLSLKIEPKERVVLFGPSGCGKSTALHLIAGLVIPDAGDILVNDELVATVRKSLREPQQREIGMVFQDLALWPHMTVRENIEFGLRAKRIPEKQRRQRVKEMVDLVGLDDYLSAKPGELSGGQQQRVALARTLAVAPASC